MRGWLQRFMVGRYGQDLLNRDLSVVALVLCLVSMFTQWGWLYTFALVMLLFTIYRMFSKRLDKRGAEAMAYLQLQNKVKSLFIRNKTKALQMKTHKFYKCPSCGQQLRVPRGKGTISIDCPKCHTAFTKKT